MLKLSQIIFLLLGSALTMMGIMYLCATEFMPYHSGAIQLEWSELNPDYQGLFLGFLRGLGAGALTSGVAIVFMSVIMLRGRVQPYLFLLPAVSIGYLTLLCFATYTVYAKTPANPPLVLVLVLLGFANVASLFLWVGWRARNDS
jgi:hypothetical protein